MPELPEVETMRRGLEKYVVGHRIEDIQILVPRIFYGEKEVVKGAKVIGVRRRGKGLVIDLDNEYSFAVHVKMTGQFIYRSALGTDHPHQHTRVIFTLDNNAHLFYNDIRRFGWIRVVKTSEVEKLSFFQNLGPEPLESMTNTQFTTLMKTSSKPIKILLMDQTKIAGIGNIYANEALFESKIDPARKANSLDATEAALLFASIQKVLKKGLLHGGASEVNFLNVEGKKGSFQEYTKVYRKEGKECFTCKKIIKRTTQGGRSTFYCPFCQQ